MHCWWECKMAQLLHKTLWWFPKKFDIELPYDLAFSLLGIYSKELKARTQTDTCTPVLIAALFAMAKREKPTQISINR